MGLTILQNFKIFQNLTIFPNFTIFHDFHDFDDFPANELGNSLHVDTNSRNLKILEFLALKIFIQACAINFKISS